MLGLSGARLGNCENWAQIDCESHNEIVRVMRSGVGACRHAYFALNMSVIFWLAKANFSGHYYELRKPFLPNPNNKDDYSDSIVCASAWIVGSQNVHGYLGYKS